MSEQFPNSKLIETPKSPKPETLNPALLGMLLVSGPFFNNGEARPSWNSGSEDPAREKRGIHKQ